MADIQKIEPKNTDTEDSFAARILEETAKLTSLADEKKAEKLEKYYNMVVDYNEKVNLTAITEQEDFLRKHFLDSLAILADINVSRETFGGKNGKKIVSRETINPDQENTDNDQRETTQNVSRETLLHTGAKVIDVGTGAGFPGIPLAVFREDLRITLLDSLNKRVFFLESTIKELDLKRCDAVHARAEDLAHQDRYREAYDFCVSRAVAALPVLCEYCLPFVKKGGYFVSYKAAGADEELKTAEKAIKVLGGKLQEIRTVILPGTDIERKLIIIKKVDTTPKKYPRKAGTPTKSPL